MKRKVIFTLVMLVLAIVIYANLPEIKNKIDHYLFFDINRIKGQELLETSESPDGEYEILVYRNDGGATTDYAILCVANHVDTGKKRNIYWQYKQSDVKIEWITDKKVRIENEVLDVTKDTYDYRVKE